MRGKTARHMVLLWREIVCESKRWRGRGSGGVRRTKKGLPEPKRGENETTWGGGNRKVLRQSEND